ncbi:MAG: YcaO-related McrA-glycine thioamidation protein [Methanobacteriota archaeon]|nr:MAG: YcaO-related McrA-glycine thioamidation protein [Euryarchaeota archaeon]
MQLVSCRKGYKKDTHRAVPPEETLSRIEGRMQECGITRVADITNLDRVGIPVFSSIRPSAADGAISVYAGKGATPVEARISAMMEGIERHAAESTGRMLTLATYAECRSQGESIEPSALILPRGARADVRIPWMAGYDIARGEPVLLPACAVFHPLIATPSATNLFRTTTNGLASGNTLEEAIVHGLCEVIERDAWSLVEAARDTGPAVRCSGDGLVGDLLAKFAAAEIEVTVKEITSDIGVPTFAAVADDLKLRDPALLVTGMGTHLDASVAVLRALTEVAQSRLTQIQGAREDTSAADQRRLIGYERMKRMNRHWFGSEGEREAELPSKASDDFLEDIHTLLAMLRARGLDRVVVVDLTRSSIGVPVVRVVVPGLEVYGMDRDRIGERCRRAAADRRLSRAESSS